MIRGDFRWFLVMFWGFLVVGIGVSWWFCFSSDSWWFLVVLVRGGFGFWFVVVIRGGGPL